MIIIVVGLILLIAAVVVGVAGVLGNHGLGHDLVHSFAVFGYHVTGSDGRLFLCGIVVGAVAMAGLALLLAGAARISRRSRTVRHGLRQSRRETAQVTRERDDLIDQRETARADNPKMTAGASTVRTPPNGLPRTAATPVTDSGLVPDGSHRGRRLFRRPA